MSEDKLAIAMGALHAKGEGWFYYYRGIQNPCCDDLEGLILTAIDMETMGRREYYGEPDWGGFKWCPYCGNPVEQEIVEGVLVHEKDTGRALDETVVSKPIDNKG